MPKLRVGIPSLFQVCNFVWLIKFLVVYFSVVLWMLSWICTFVILSPVFHNQNDHAFRLPCLCMKQSHYEQSHYGALMCISEVWYNYSCYRHIPVFLHFMFHLQWSSRVVVVVDQPPEDTLLWKCLELVTRDITCLITWWFSVYIY